MTVRRVTSRENALVKELARLAASSRERRLQQSTILEGERLVGAFAASGHAARLLVVGESAAQRPSVARLLAETPATDKLLVPDRLLDGVTQVVTSSGVLAVVQVPRAAPVPEQPGACLLLEGIQDPGNLGSMFRTAAAAGMRDIYLAPGCVFAWAPKVVRAGMGAHFALSIREECDLVDLVRRIAVPVVATEPLAPRSIHAIDLSRPVAWIFGGEADGLSPALAALASVRASIPMQAGSESLNVAAAAAICLFEGRRQQAAAPGP